MGSKLTRLQVGDRAPVITLADPQGREVTLDEQVWSQGPTLMSFLRHFGCIHCRNRMAQLELHKDDLQAAGLKLVAVALGEPKHAERYCGKLAPSLTCFAATSNDPYTAWGLRRGTVGEFVGTSFKMMGATLKAMRNGQMQGEATGDVQMLPGTFIVDQAGIIRYAYYSAYAGDDPEIDVLVDAGRKLSSQGAAR